VTFWEWVTTTPGWLMITSSPARGTEPVLQLLPALQSPPAGLIQDTVAGNASAIASDLKTLSADKATLLNDLGSTSQSRVVSRIFTGLLKDLQSLNADLTSLGTTNHGHGGRDDDRDEHGSMEESHEQSTGREYGEDEGGEDEGGEERNLGQVGTVIRDVLSVRQDLQALVKTLGSNITSTVTNDVQAVQSALGSVIGDLVTGTSVTQDLTKLNDALTTLTTDVGTGSATQGILTSLKNDVQTLTSDVTALTTPSQAALQRIQSDVQNLEGLLGSNLSSAAQADVAALDAAITSLGKDVGNPLAITNDLTNALKSEFSLFRDLTRPLPAGTQHSLLRLATDLIRLSPVLSM